MTELWLVDLKEAAAGLAELEAETPRLSAGDRQRALRLPHRGEQRLRLAAYCALRLALERLAGACVRQRAYTFGRAGAPYLRGTGVRFSLSHTGGIALIGVTRARAIGVDVEGIRAVRLSERRRQELLAVGAGLAMMAAGKRAPAAHDIVQAWTRIEAFAKARGCGLARVLEDLRLRGPVTRILQPARLTAVAAAEAARRALWVSDLAPGGDLVGAIALDATVALPSLRRFPGDSGSMRRLLAEAGAGVADASQSGPTAGRG
jgi:4'-phosphopantetheinyl transferase